MQQSSLSLVGLHTCTTSVKGDLRCSTSQAQSTQHADEQVDSESFDGIEQRLRKVIMSGSSQSTLPAIYGVAVSQDTKRLRPLSHAVEVGQGLAPQQLMPVAPCNHGARHAAA